jgi:hypothetical protein
MTTPGAEEIRQLDLQCVNPTLDAVYEVLSDRSLRDAVMDTDHDARARAMQQLGFPWMLGARFCKC